MKFFNQPFCATTQHIECSVMDYVLTYFPQIVSFIGIIIIFLIIVVLIHTFFDLIRGKE